MRKHKILWISIQRHPEALRSLIREKLYEAGFEVLESSYETIDELDEFPLEQVSAVILTPARRIPVAYLARLQECRLIQIWSSGYDKFNIQDAVTFGLRVANNNGANADSVAEHTMLMILGLSRRVIEMHGRVVAGNWSGNDHGMSSSSLKSKTLGLIGMGRIGSRVARLAHAFGMKVIYVDPEVPPSVFGDSFSRVEMDDLLCHSDYISLHIHSNHSTQGLISFEEFRKMEGRPFLINPSRADLVNRDSLIAALKSGRIRGLAMDAHYVEPTSPSDELWEFDNLLVSPHVAGSTFESYAHTMDFCIDNANAAISGIPVRSVVSPAE